MATQPQIDAYNDLKPDLGRRQAQVLNIIQLKSGGGATLREIADELQLELSSVSGRVRELVEKKRLINSGRTRMNLRSGKAMTVWTEPVGQLVML